MRTVTTVRFSVAIRGPVALRTVTIRLSFERRAITVGFSVSVRFSVTVGRSVRPWSTIVVRPLFKGGPLCPHRVAVLVEGKISKLYVAGDVAVPEVGAPLPDRVEAIPIDAACTALDLFLNEGSPVQIEFVTEVDEVKLVLTGEGDLGGEKPGGKTRLAEIDFSTREERLDERLHLLVPSLSRLTTHRL